MNRTIQNIEEEICQLAIEAIRKIVPAQIAVEALALEPANTAEIRR